MKPDFLLRLSGTTALPASAQTRPFLTLLQHFSPRFAFSLRFSPSVLAGLFCFSLQSFADQIKTNYRGSWVGGGCSRRAKTCLSLGLCFSIANYCSVSHPDALKQLFLTSSNWPSFHGEGGSMYIDCICFLGCFLGCPVRFFGWLVNLFLSPNLDSSLDGAEDTQGKVQPP